MSNARVFMWSNLAITEVAKYDTIGDMKKMYEPLQCVIGYSKIQAVKYTALALSEYYNIKYDKDDTAEKLIRGLKSTDAVNVFELCPLLQLSSDVLGYDFMECRQLPENTETAVSSMHEAVILALQYLSIQPINDAVPACDLIKYNKLLYRM